MEAEQAYIDNAYERLREIRDAATARANEHARNRETSFQGIYERDVAVHTALERAASLDVGEESLVFGRTDDDQDRRYYIGRRAVFDPTHAPLVIDWRVPAAEPFYRATGMHPMGLVQRRHFQCEGRRLLAIEDQRFVDGAVDGDPQQALLQALERPRTGHMRDIVATVQAEQDEVIRDQLEGVLAVQGGPGTGKTAVALHRAAYLLFTYRKTLGRQGMLVIGPTHRFLAYIDRVLPALGEGGVTLATLGDLAPHVEVALDEPLDVARVKGDARMAEVIARAVRDRQRPLDADLSVTFDDVTVVIRRRILERLIASARRNRRSHNARRAMLKTIVIDQIYQRYRATTATSRTAVGWVGRAEAVRLLRADATLEAAVEAMWPMLTPQALLADLFASPERLERAAHNVLRREEIAFLARGADEPWTQADVPLLDEAVVLLGQAIPRLRVASLESDDTDEVDVFGHILVDEAQDLSPMAFRMITRRSLTGSVTLVGDLAQAFGAVTPGSWPEILQHLPDRRGVRVRELTVNYRTPGSIMDVAARILREAAPELAPPSSARDGGEPLAFVEGPPLAVAAQAATEHRASGEGTMAVIVPHGMLRDAIVAVGDADDGVIALIVEEAKGLEFDAVVVVEPARIVRESPHGLRALYVALTRATRRVVVAHAEPLPPALRIPEAAQLT